MQYLQGVSEAANVVEEVNDVLNAVQAQMAEIVEAMETGLSITADYQESYRFSGASRATDRCPHRGGDHRSVDWIVGFTALPQRWMDRYGFVLFTLPQRVYECSWMV